MTSRAISSIAMEEAFTAFHPHPTLSGTVNEAAQRVVGGGRSRSSGEFHCCPDGGGLK